MKRRRACWTYPRKARKASRFLNVHAGVLQEHHGNRVAGFGATRLQIRPGHALRKRGHR